MTGNTIWSALFEELEPTPGRWRRAARVGLITALGAGATAAMQITDPLGLTLLFNFALPEAAFSPARGAAFLFCAAVFQMLGLVLVGALVDSPVVHITVFVLLCFFTTYLIYAVPTLGRLWVWIQVPVVSAFYMAMFLPDHLGWDAAQEFAGMAIAVAVLLLCNSIVRPEPAESVLADSIAATLTLLRLRLASLIEISLDEAPDADERPVASRLGPHLALLGPTITSASSAAVSAALLADVIVAEAVRGQTERLAAAVLAGGGGRRPPAAAAGELRALAAALDLRLERRVGDLRHRAGRAYSASGAIPLHEAHPQPPAPADADDAGLAARLARLGAETPELAAITAPIARICELLENDRGELPSALNELPSGDSESEEPAAALPAVAKNFLVRYSARHTIALTAAFLIGLWDNNPALHAAIWLLMLGGPPSHGATVRKFTMRAIGASGALAVAALGTIVVAPNFTSPGPYMAAIFAGTLLMAYIGEGGGILSYLAIGGTAFVIGYGGPGPRADVIGSIWSIWGISLGMIIRAVVSLLWRERPSRTLAEQFQAPLAAILELLPRGDGSRSDDSQSEGSDDKGRRAAAEMATVASIAMILTVANDAILEGPGAEIDGGQLVDALDTLRRLAFAIGNLRDLPDLPDLPNLGMAGTAVSGRGVSGELTDAIRVRVESWMRCLRDQTDSGVVSRAPLRQMVAEAEAGIDRSNGTTPSHVVGHVIAHVLGLIQTLENQLAAVSRN